MGGVFTVGYAPAVFLPGQRALVAYPDGLTREHLDELTGFVSDTVAAHGHAVAIYPAWSAEPARRRLETVRSALATDRLALYATDLPPLAGAVLTAMADAVLEVVGSAGALVGLLPALERQLLGVTWLARVSGLRQPAPTVWQHLMSLMPGTAFAACTWPEPSVRRLTRKRPEVPLPQLRGAPGLGLALSSRDGDRAWMRAQVVAPLGDVAVVEVPPTPGAARYWGATRLVEAIAYPIDASTIAAAVSQGVSRRLCEWCGQDVVDIACPFCGLTGRDDPARGPAARRAPSPQPAEARS